MTVVRVFFKTYRYEVFDKQKMFSQFFLNNRTAL